MNHLSPYPQTRCSGEGKNFKGVYCIRRKYENRKNCEYAVCLFLHGHQLPPSFTFTYLSVSKWHRLQLAEVVVVCNEYEPTEDRALCGLFECMIFDLPLLDPSNHSELYSFLLPFGILVPGINLKIY
jgi:hypothetical protein